jgi:hypothetical protein
LRDVTLARAEDEVAREILLRLPTARRNVIELRQQALLRERNFDLDSSRPAAPPTPSAEDAANEGAIGAKTPAQAIMR